MVLVSCYPHRGLPYQSFTSLQMPQVHWDMAPFLIMSGLLANGPLGRSLCRLRTSCCFLWLLHSIYGATVGLQNAWSSVLTIWRWSACYVRAPLLRYLSLRAARHSFAFTASHRAGRDNCIADALSSFDFQRFHHLAPHAALVANPHPTITAGSASCNLTDKCHFYLANGLAPSTHQVYGSAQHQFSEFCSQDSPSNWNQPLLPANEQTLMRFCAHLADRLHHTSIKVYLSAVQSLRIDYGFPDQLTNCLQLQRLLWGIN